MVGPNDKAKGAGPRDVAVAVSRSMIAKAGAAAAVAVTASAVIGAEERAGRAAAARTAW